MPAIKAAAPMDATRKLMVVLERKIARLKNKTKKEEAALKKARVASEKKLILGKATEGQEKLIDTSEAPDQNCLIKGNINQKKEKIYHTPWSSPHYKRTKIDTGKGERWFCTESDARRAGWRAPYR